jgi:uncharacterized protein (DUF2126 family)
MENDKYPSVKALFDYVEDLTLAWRRKMRPLMQNQKLMRQANAIAAAAADASTKADAAEANAIAAAAADRQQKQMQPKQMQLKSRCIGSKRNSSSSS